MILLWGLLEDGTMCSVYDRLQRSGADLLFLNHADIDNTEIYFSTDPAPHYLLQYKGKEYNLDNFTSAYLRPYNFRDYAQFSGKENSSPVIKSADVFHHLLHSWAEHSDATIINKPSAEATNHSKLFQSTYIAASGFGVPESLVSNDKAEILEFHAKHKSLIYKSMSSVRSIVKEFSPADLPAGENLGLVFFQQKLVGKNIRVHVVGEKVFSCQINSEDVDYRYGKTQLQLCTIPEEISARCITLAKNLGLHLAGIDLMLSEDGNWYCFEVNPSPGFSYYDISPEESIAQAVAEAMIA